MKKSSIVWIVLLAAIVAVAWAVSSYHGSSAPEDQATTTTTPVPVATQPGADWKTFTNAANGFSVRYPQGWTAKGAFTYDALGPGKEIPGFAFAVPASTTAGTNLSNDSYLSVEILAGRECTAASFLDQTMETATVTENGHTWSTAKGGGAGAGNLYDETVYATSANGRCYGLRQFLHSSNIYNYDPSSDIREFDRAALDETYAQFRATFQTL